MNELERCQYLENRVLYDNKTGKLFWKPKDGNGRYERAFNKRLANKEITYKIASGYISIRFYLNGRTHFQVAHRLIWYIENRKTPENFLDHIDGNRENNLISNLRDVTQEVNMRNASKRKNNTSGVTGVYYSKSRNKWIAQAVGGKSRHIGVFDSKEDAENAVRKRRLELGYTENHGRENCK
jgi:hypothetical protein